MVLSTIGRLIWVAITFVLSGLAAGFVLVTLGLERVTQAFHDRAWSTGSIDDWFKLLDQTTILLSSLTVIPALIVVIVGEIARIRSSLYYIIGGGLALALVPVLARFGQAGVITDTLPAAPVWQVFATAGFLGGWVYWLLAGRRA